MAHRDLPSSTIGLLAIHWLTHEKPTAGVDKSLWRTTPRTNASVNQANASLLLRDENDPLFLAPIGEHVPATRLRPCRGARKSSARDAPAVHDARTRGILVDNGEEPSRGHAP